MGLYVPDEIALSPSPRPAWQARGNVVAFPTLVTAPVRLALVATAAALRFATVVVLATTKGAAPGASVDVICPVALSVVKAPAAGVVPPIAPGAAKVAPLREEALRFTTLVVEATTSGA